MAPNNIPLHPLGRNGPLVPAIGQGLMAFSAIYGEALTEEQVFAILDKAHEIGSRFWDTAEYVLLIIRVPRLGFLVEARAKTDVLRPAYMAHVRRLSASGSKRRESVKISSWPRSLGMRLTLLACAVIRRPSMPDRPVPRVFRSSTRTILTSVC
jgi:hypothetical protein